MIPIPYAFVGGRRLLLLALALAVAPAAAHAQQPKPEELPARAKAILTRYCFDCHGRNPNRISKRLKVLDHAGMLASKRKIVVPGSPDASLLIKRVESKDDPMPPEDRPQPSDAERQVLRAWVKAGAVSFDKAVAQTAPRPAPTPATTQPPPAPKPAPPTPKPAPPAPAPADTRPGSLDEELLRQAPQILKLLHDKGYKNVGVLKFRVLRPGDGAASDNVGTLNQTLASRLELALTLADEDKNPLGIVRDASIVASLIPKANHLLKDGRKVLFAPKYPLAWGDDPVKVDVFLIGGALLSSDLRRMSVQFRTFGKDGAVSLLGEDGQPFFVNCDPGLLIEAGESFLVRGGLKGDGPLAPARAIDAAVALRNQQVVSPLLDREAPVKLEVRYDGTVVPVRFQDGRFQVPEPKAGQKVSFAIRRQPGIDDRLGVVLKVNGQSTLSRERLSDFRCRKWVLEPGVASLTVDRIRTDRKDDPGDLALLAVPPSKADEVRYTPDIGTLSLIVFREAKGPSAARAAADLAVLEGGGFPEDQASNLAALKEQLRKGATSENAARGLAAPAKEGDEPKEATFKADPTPVMALTITCQRP